MCRYFMSIEWIVVKILVAPWTMLSRVSGKTTGVQEARKTNSLRLQTGTNGRKWPSTRTTCGEKANNEIYIFARNGWCVRIIGEYFKSPFDRRIVAACENFSTRWFDRETAFCHLESDYFWIIDFAQSYDLACRSRRTRCPRGWVNPPENVLFYCDLCFKCSD